MSRLTHPHTFLGGLVAGLVLDREALLLAGGAFLLGVLATVASRYLAGLLRWARRRLTDEGPTGPGPNKAW